MIPSVFPSLGFILALSNCTQTAIMWSLCMHGMEKLRKAVYKIKFKPISTVVEE